MDKPPLPLSSPVTSAVTSAAAPVLSTTSEPIPTRRRVVLDPYYTPPSSTPYQVRDGGLWSEQE